MKSSSQLFSVTLMQADVVGDRTDDVYLVKHGRDPDQSVQVALSHVGLYGQKSKGKQPVVLVHGSFTNRNFWLSAQGIGFARYLVESGFDVWMMEMRGHGLSPRNMDYKNNNLERYALYDVPAVNDFIIEKTGIKPIWLGHSLGGVLISTAIACGSLTEDRISAIALLGSQVVRRRWFLQIPFAASLAKLWFKFQTELDGRKLRIGPENEPAGIAREYLNWVGLFGSWSLSSDKAPLRPKWSALSTPMLTVVGKNDQSDPAKYCRIFYDQYGAENKSFKLLAADEGFSRDFGHVDMVVSKEAAEEVWPKLTAWLAGIELESAV